MAENIRAYSDDYAGWVEDTALAIEAGRFRKIDLKRSPSLRPELPEFLEDAYDEARIDASNETGIDIDDFPETCEWPLSEVLTVKPTENSNS